MSSTIALTSARSIHAGHGYALYDQDGICTVVDPVFCDILGRDESELVGMSWLTFSHPDDLKIEMLINESLRHTRSPGGRFLKRCVRGDGTDAWAWAEAEPIELPDGRHCTSVELEPVDVGRDDEWRKALFEALLNERQQRYALMERVTHNEERLDRMAAAMACFSSVIAEI